MKLSTIIHNIKNVSLSALVMLAMPLLVNGQFDPSRGIGETNLPNTPFQQILQTILQYGLQIITILAILGFVASGLVFIVGGAAGKGEVGRRMFMSTIIGVIVALSGYIIIRLISELLSGQAQAI